MKGLSAIAAAAVLACASACGGSPTAPSHPPATPGPNHAPVIASMSVSPEFGITDLQPFTFSVVATDPDGDALTYVWDFGVKGESPVTEAAPTFDGTYTGGSTGRLTVTVTVTDSHGAKASASDQIVLGSVNGGLWTLTKGGRLTGSLFALAQSGDGSIVGNYGLVGSPSQDHLTGSINIDGEIVLSLRVGSRPLTLRGVLDRTGADAGLRITGTMSGAVSGAFVLTRDG